MNIKFTGQYSSKIFLLIFPSGLPPVVFKSPRPLFFERLIYLYINKFNVK